MWFSKYVRLDMWRSGDQIYITPDLHKSHWIEKEKSKWKEIKAARVGFTIMGHPRDDRKFYPLLARCWIVNKDQGFVTDPDELDEFPSPDQLKAERKIEKEKITERETERNRAIDKIVEHQILLCDEIVEVVNGLGYDQKKVSEIIRAINDNSDALQLLRQGTV